MVAAPKNLMGETLALAAGGVDAWKTSSAGAVKMHLVILANTHELIAKC